MVLKHKLDIFVRKANVKVSHTDYRVTAVDAINDRRQISWHT